MIVSLYLFYTVLFVTLVMLVDFIGDIGVQPTWRVPFFIKGRRHKAHPDAEHYWSPVTLAAWLVITVSAGLAVFGGH